MRSVIWLVVIAACNKNGQPPEGERPSVAAVDVGIASRAQPNAAKETGANATGADATGATGAKQAVTPSADIPAWAPLDNIDGPPARPTAWKADGRPTLVVFSASWCPGCTASALADRALVRTHGKHFQVGVALQESDDDFAASTYARALSGVPVWSEASTKQLTDVCHPVAIPSACLFERGKALWSGGASDAVAVLQAHRAGKLADWLAGTDSTDERARLKVKQALVDPAMIPEVVALLHGRADSENSIAWRLVDRDDPTPNEVALAVALSRDAVALDGGIDFAHLDTYALALAQAGRVADAAYVGARVIEVCKAVQGKCPEEKRRALAFIERARSL